MSRLGWHVNAWTAEATRSIQVAPTHLKLLNTALNPETVRDWQARAGPDKLLVYRHVFDGGDDRDVLGRCDVLSREAEQLLPFGPVIVETPWNEERQFAEHVAAYAADTITATRILRARGFKVAVGHYSVTWPTDEVFRRFAPAIAEADYYSAHEYYADRLVDAPDSHIGRAARQMAMLPESQRRPILLTEFGVDRGVLGSQYARQGWRDAGLTAEQYAAELRWWAMRMPSSVTAMFVFAAGGIYGWQSFEVGGEWSIESLLREEYPVYEFVLGFAEFARALRSRGIDPGEPTEHEQPRVFEDGWVVTRQQTTTGVLLWIKALNDMFWVGRDRRVVAYNGGALRIA